MSISEFEEIIKPLYLLDKSKSKFLRDAMLNNFRQWESKQKNILTNKNYKQ